MTHWQLAWRTLITPRLPLAGLTALADEVRDGGHRLTASAFVVGDAIDTPTCGCAIGFAIWQGDPAQTVTDVANRVTTLLAECAVLSGATRPCVTTFTTWFDREYERDRFRLMDRFLPEVEWAVVTRLADGVVTLTEDWWDRPNPAFDGQTPWAELVTFGRERLERMIYHIGSGVAS